MIIAEVAVDSSSAKTIACAPLPVGGAGLKVRFQFLDPMWHKLSKTIVFRNRNSTFDAVLIDDCAIIPHEVLTYAADVLYVGVYGTDSRQLLAIPTVWTKLNEISSSANPSGASSAEPTLPYWAQIKEQFDSISDDMLRQEDVSTILLEAKATGLFDGPQGARGEKGSTGAAGKDGTDGKTPVRGIDYWTNADKAEIRSYVDEAILGGAW